MSATPALRYYEERGLLQPTRRQAGVRHYDRTALRSLALLQLWHRDGMMTLDDTAALMAGPEPSRWRDLLATRADGLNQQIEQLSTAKAALDHFLDCTNENPAACPVIDTMLDERIDQALGAEESE